MAPLLALYDFSAMREIAIARAKLASAFTQVRQIQSEERKEERKREGKKKGSPIYAAAIVPCLLRFVGIARLLFVV